MYVLLVRCVATERRSTIHLVDEQGRHAHAAASVQAALAWLVDRDEHQVVAMTDVGPELFLIEPCEGLQMTLPSLSLRRAFYGRCSDEPPLPGLDPDPALRARILEDRQETALDRRRRRSASVRRATET